MQAKLPSQTLAFISSIINAHSYKKPVLQLPKSLLSQSFDLVANLRKLCPQDVEFFVLYDSMKKQCCTDIIGARHVDYDALFHIGYACFSQKIDEKCWYVLPEAQWDGLEQGLKEKSFADGVKEKGITLLLCDQGLYKRVMSMKEYLEKEVEVEIARLPFDKREDDRYLGFGYYCQKDTKTANVLVLKPDSLQSTKSSNPTSELLLENLYLCLKSLSISTIHTLTPSNPLTLYTPQNSKRLMQRLSQISELESKTVFGILVSNPSTKFCQEQIQRCRQILDQKGLKHFTFMMNNLNECKLGNFPEIQVYVVIACYNYSLYGIKDFYRLVVAPFDLEIAFADASYEMYRFDLNTQIPKGLKIKQEPEFPEQKAKLIPQPQTCSSLTKTNDQVSIEHMIQTLDFYHSREYKGLQFEQKKEIEKVKLGKVGIANQYRSLESKEEQKGQH